MHGDTERWLSEQLRRASPFCALTLPYPPSTNRIWRTYRGATVKSEEARSYHDGCRALLYGQIERATTLPVLAVLRFYRPRRRGDIDNRIKIVLDALNGIVYADDEQIEMLIVARELDRQRPRVEIAIYTIGA